MRIRMVESYLTEDIEAVKRQYSYVPAEEFDFIIRLDPTFNENRDSVGKYGKWLLGLYKKDDVLLQRVLTAYRDGNNAGMQNWGRAVTDTIQKYDNAKNDRTVDIEKDISKIKSLKDMLDLTQNAGIKELSKRQKSRMIKQSKDYDLVFENDKYYVFVPKNYAGDMQLASFGHSEKATWCTAVDDTTGENYYEEYLEDGGYYYVLINKNNYNEKYQFHFESKQFMDANDDDINLRSFLDENPDIQQFFIKDAANRREATKKRQVAGAIRYFGLSSNIDEKELALTQSFAIDNIRLGSIIYDNLRNDYNKEFSSAAANYVKWGDNEFWYTGSHYSSWEEVFAMAIEKSWSVSDSLEGLGLTSTMIDDFCNDISGFMDNLDNGVYDEEIKREDDEASLALIYQDLLSRLQEAQSEAERIAYGNSVVAAIDKSLECLNIYYDNAIDSYTLEDDYLSCYKKLVELHVAEPGINIKKGSIDDYIETLINEDYILEEPYYGFDATPDKETIVECLMDSLAN